MPEGYCEIDDVGDVLQDDFDGSNPAPIEVEAAIVGLTEDLRRRTRQHWYDSAGGTSLVPTDARSVSDNRLDVPASPHRQDRQLLSQQQGVRYPVTQAGPYARIQLPHGHVQSITTLDVRDRDGDVTDWVADSSFVSGRGEDYYLHTDGDTLGTSYLYIRATSIGTRVDFGDLLTVAYDYGVDAQSTSWESVRSGVAHLAAADLVLDDDVKTAIPDDGQLIAVESKADRHVNQAMRRLGTYFRTPTE